jgi:methionyl-tRNA formyltransferase
MRAAFFGHVRYSAVILERLAGVRDIELACVVTRSKPGANADFLDLAPMAAALGVPVVDVDTVPQTDWPGVLAAQAAEVGFALGWSTLLDQAVIDVFPNGIVGYHPAPLPRNRGHHPIIWALALGLRQTASNLFMLDAGVDSGPIVSRRVVDIEDDDDAGTLYSRLTAIAADQVEEVAAALVAGRLVAVPQDQSARSVWRKRGYADGRIDWRMSARSIHNLVRALTRPYVGAHMTVDGADYKVWRTRLPRERSGRDDVEPGRVLIVDGRAFVVKCGEGELTLVDHELPALPRPGRCL